MSRSRKSQSSRTVDPPTEGLDSRAELEEVATKLFALCVPWSEQWAVCGALITSVPTDDAQRKSFRPQQITHMDDLGIEIMTHLPHHLVSDFLSEAGQAIVSLSNHTSMLTTT